MAKYDKEELWKKEYLKVPEMAYLLNIARQNAYSMVDKGVFSTRTARGENGRKIIVVPRSEVYDYILKRRAELYKRADKYRLPEEPL